jgi:hypothetical protein
MLSLWLLAAPQILGFFRIGLNNLPQGLELKLVEDLITFL